MEGRIYCITNIINSKKYIGQTIKPLKNRFNEHYKDSLKDIKTNRPLQKAMKKYGLSNFKIRTIKLFNNKNRKTLKKMLNKMEIYYIHRYNTFYGDGYNASIGGDGGDVSGKLAHMYGKKHSKETIEKMSKVRLNTPNPAKRVDVRKKISIGVRKHNKIYGSSTLGKKCLKKLN